MDAVLEIFDNGLEACYHPELEAGKRKAIFLTYGKALDTDKLALEIFDGGIGMAGMNSSTGGIAAWAALVSFCSTNLSCLGTAVVGLAAVTACVIVTPAIELTALHFATSRYACPALVKAGVPVFSTRACMF